VAPHSVLRLSEPVSLPGYGQLLTEGLLDQLYAQDKQQPYAAVGYGLEGSGRRCHSVVTRGAAELQLVSPNGVCGVGNGTSAKFSSNANTGGAGCSATNEQAGDPTGRLSRTLSSADVGVSKICHENGSDG
jgi:hypothetical protein